jgi:hypothetical protein
MHCPDPRPNLAIYPACLLPTLYGAVMRLYMPFMAALVLFGAVACGASSSSSTSSTSGSSSSSSSKPTAAQQAAAINKATCQKVTSAAWSTKSQATAYISLLEAQASQAGVDNTLSSDMMTLSTVLTGHEAGTKTLTTAKVTAAQTTLTTACQKWAK